MVKDLDLNFHLLHQTQVVTPSNFWALLAPLNVCAEIKQNKLSLVPLRLWFFTTASTQITNYAWDRINQRFEDWQFDWLFRKKGWKIYRPYKIPNTVTKWISPLLRKFNKILLWCDSASYNLGLVLVLLLNL